MKQNIISKGEVELEHAEVVQALVVLSQEDRNVLMTAVKNYLKTNHGYTLKKMASSIVNNEIVVKAEVEFVQTQVERPFFNSNTEVKDAPIVRRGANSKATVRKNTGLYGEMMDYLKTATNGGKKPVDFETVYESMRTIFPDLQRRKFMIYCSDKRQQKIQKFALNVKMNGNTVVSKTLNLA
jgi:hypothetical protein